MEQNFWQHLSELRIRLIKIACASLLGFLLSLFLSSDLLQLITAPAGHLVFLRPAEALVGQLKIALINGVLVSLPVSLWQIGVFFRPALYPHERKYLAFFLPFTFLFFCVGLGFGYFVVVRLGYQFLLSFATENIQPMISLATYLSFVLSSMLLCGLLFLLPIAVLLLTRIGLLTTRFLWSQQKPIIIGLAMIVAIITPTVDVFSMILVFVPLLALFELSIFLAWLTERKNKLRFQLRSKNC
jgi:Twin arginine targeting (Tat) protein translocase TatC